MYLDFFMKCGGNILNEQQNNSRMMPGQMNGGQVDNSRMMPGQMNGGQVDNSRMMPGQVYGGWQNNGRMPVNGQGRMEEQLPRLKTWEVLVYFLIRLAFTLAVVFYFRLEEKPEDGIGYFYAAVYALSVVHLFLWVRKKKYPVEKYLIQTWVLSRAMDLMFTILVCLFLALIGTIGMLRLAGIGFYFLIPIVPWIFSGLFSGPGLVYSIRARQAHGYSRAKVIGSLILNFIPGVCIAQVLVVGLKNKESRKFTMIILFIGAAICLIVFLILLLGGAFLLKGILEAVFG
jgi:hypothetical protein